MDGKKDIFIYNGLKVAYKTVGVGKPLILLHGWGTDSTVLSPLAFTLADMRTCYLVDLPGFGSTPPPDSPWAIDDYADLIEAMITNLGKGEVDLLAHSFGGRITLKLLSRPETASDINKVLITGGAGLKPKRKPVFYFKKYLAKTLKAPLYILPHTQRDRALTRLRKTALWKSLGSSDYQALQGVMRETFVKSVSEYLDPLLPLISHDILLLWGEDDEATPLYQGQRMEKGLKKGSLVVIENAGHYAFLDKPKQFTAITRAYYKGSSSGT